MRKNNQYYLRKAHRWLGVTIGIQFIFWTVSGIYFSWTDIDEIHGDHFIDPPKKMVSIPSLNIADSTLKISEMALRIIEDHPYLWVNDSILLDAATGDVKQGVTQQEAEQIAQTYVKDDFRIKSSMLITDVNEHHEYRGKPLPAWAIHFDGDEALTAYVVQKDGSFQRVRHRAWRWFDFLWMTHTMDYEARDDFNNLLLRAFSLFGLLTVASGFVLFFITTKKKRKKKK